MKQQTCLSPYLLAAKKNRSHYIDNIELNFNFTEMNVSQTFTLIDMLYRETDKNTSYS